MASQVAQLISLAIHAGEFPAGSRLVEERLADRYKVSRTPVREALHLLASSGLIEARWRHGAIVREASLEETDDLSEALCELEASCARLAAMSMSPPERLRLASLSERLENPEELSGWQAREETVRKLRDMICSGCHNATMLELTIATRMHLEIAGRHRAMLEDRGTKDYRSVVMAIMKGDAAAAGLEMRNSRGQRPMRPPTPVARIAL